MRVGAVIRSVHCRTGSAAAA